MLGSKQPIKFGSGQSTFVEIGNNKHFIKTFDFGGFF